MATSSAKPTRSISLPSRLHPDSEKIEAQLNKLRTNWESPPLGIEAIQSGLADLVQLYNSTKEVIIQSPLTQQALSQPSSRKTIEDTLEGSIALLDACGAARDLLMRTKESLRALQSSLRRKAIGDSSSVEAYLSFRKSAKRDIAKSLRALKMTRASVQAFSSLHDQDHSLQVVIGVMRELSIVAVSVFRCLFVFLSEPMTKTKASRWGLISKLVPMITSSEKEEKFLNEVGRVDISVVSLQGQLRKKTGKSIEVELVQKRLKALDNCVEGLDSGLDSLFRCLIQQRVSLLNLITPS